ncbi:hypothetical protein A6770_07040 [Nostoc minutum NIES-26]|uniref:Low temperature-induced protein n=1 Tax=Nostoc minutum NIES-26 TaxID=1844469 RepID=A0A367S3M3_9NOSO|nr:hypothetical protein A6770_07040 [Nostoc minutum NIES-26]
MSFIRFIQPIVRPLRFVIAAALCLTLVVSNAFPAAAIGSSKSSPTEGTTQLNKIQKKTDEVARSAPPNLEEVQSESERGLNEVQGDADKNKMKRPENSQNATSVIDKVEDYLGKVTGDK